jgi:RNA polymerase sigma-70 factor (ECF subfamily)
VIEKPQKIENFFREYYTELCFLSYQYVNNVRDSEDVVQDVFVKIINQENYLNIENLSAYFRTAVRNASLKKVQRTKKLISLNDQMLDSLESGNIEDLESIHVEKWNFINERIDKLPPKCKKFFLLCALNGMKYQEAANSQNVSINTVKTQIKKAYKLLRKSVEEVNLFLLFYK